MHVTTLAFRLIGVIGYVSAAAIFAAELADAAAQGPQHRSLFHAGARGARLCCLCGVKPAPSHAATSVAGNPTIPPGAQDTECIIAGLR